MAETYIAPILAVAIILIMVLRSVTKCLERRCCRIPLWAHYYTWLYALLLYLILKACHTMYWEILRPTSWLSPEETEKTVMAMMRLDGEDLDVTLPAWRREASLSDYGPLVLFSLGAPIWVMLTFAVTLFHIFRHVQAVAERRLLKGTRGLVDSVLHDRTIVIIPLPLVYGFMSFLAVMRQWQICINRIGPASERMFGAWEERKRFLNEMYEANFMVAEIYETIALVAFCKLIMAVLTDTIMKNFHDLLRQVKPNSSGQMQKTDSELADLESFAKTIIGQLTVSLKSLTVAGVKLFSYTCLVQGSYILSVTTMGYYGLFPRWFGHTLGHIGYFQREEVESSVKILFMGAGIVASTAAIANIMTIEHSYEFFLHDFHPFVKFWCTKILVTLSFLQSIFFSCTPPFSDWSETRVNLLYSSCLTFECFLISVASTFAWRHDEPWYAAEDFLMEGGRRRSFCKDALSDTMLEEIQMVEIRTEAS
eukprot:TRINITY_DN57070_c0_g1_i1.p1 TRINITY_DN57070_c0_g1~~TRINITY_DN57070_c0_g1_i1.p1  ORF type:complete len:480 (+),score=75.12 TRINITY_DN57070_c0_g1_i1:218-1657(+)